jgi:hypothetical protein
MAIAYGSEYAATIDEKWDSDIEEYRYSESVLLERVLSKSALVAKSGDIVNMTIEPVLSVGTVTEATGAFVMAAVTPTAKTITINQSKYVSIASTNRADAQAFWTPESVFPKSAARALAESYDNYLGSLFTQSTLSQIGSQSIPVPMNSNNVRAGLLRLANAKVPLTDLTLAVDPRALLIDVLDETAYSMAYAIGGSAKTPLITGDTSFPVVGCKTAMTTQLTIVGGAVVQCAVFHKSALAIAMQRKHEFERFSLAPTGVAGKGVLMTSLYGASLFRTDHLCVINTPVAA